MKLSLTKLSRILTLASMVAAVPIAAHAASPVSVYSDATIDSGCQFVSQTSGTLSLYNNNMGVSSATSRGGIPATVTITYILYPTLSFGAMGYTMPTQPTGQVISSLYASPVSANPGNMSQGWTVNSSDGSASGGTYSGGTTDTITLNQTINFGKVVSPGLYSFTNVATCT